MSKIAELNKQLKCMLSEELDKGLFGEINVSVPEIGGGITIRGNRNSIELGCYFGMQSDKKHTLEQPITDEEANNRSEELANIIQEKMNELVSDYNNFLAKYDYK